MNHTFKFEVAVVATSRVGIACNRTASHKQQYNVIVTTAAIYKGQIYNLTCNFYRKTQLAP